MKVVNKGSLCAECWLDLREGAQQKGESQNWKCPLFYSKNSLEEIEFRCADLRSEAERSRIFEMIRTLTEVSQVDLLKMWGREWTEGVGHTYLAATINLEVGQDVSDEYLARKRALVVSMGVYREATELFRKIVTKVRSASRGYPPMKTLHYRKAIDSIIKLEMNNFWKNIEWAIQDRLHSEVTQVHQDGIVLLRSLK